jgi:hypothetical protein
VKNVFNNLCEVGEWKIGRWVRYIAGDAQGWQLEDFASVDVI